MVIRTLGIDVGIQHLGIAIVEGAVNAKPIHLDLVDLTRMGNSGKMCHRVCKFLHVNKSLFQELDGIFIEQQPPRGIQSVEQLLFLLLSDKAPVVELVSPVRLQKWLGTWGTTYDERKQGVEAWCHAQLSQHPELPWLQYFHSLERKHDVADATALAMYGWEGLVADAQTKVRLEQLKQNGFDLSSFAYRGKDKGLYPP